MCRAASTVIFWGNIRLGEELKATASTLVMSVDKVKVRKPIPMSLQQCCKTADENA
jgi:hypothetical protein